LEFAVDWVAYLKKQCDCASRYARRIMGAL